MNKDDICAVIISSFDLSEKQALLLDHFVKNNTDVSMSEIAIDSLSAMELSITFEANFGISIEPEIILSEKSVGSLVEKLIALKANQETLTP
jgi:acyl carrier protein